MMIDAKDLFDNVGRALANFGKALATVQLENGWSSRFDRSKSLSNNKNMNIFDNLSDRQINTTQCSEREYQYIWGVVVDNEKSKGLNRLDALLKKSDILFYDLQGSLLLVNYRLRGRPRIIQLQTWQFRKDRDYKFDIQDSEAPDITAYPIPVVYGKNNVSIEVDNPYPTNTVTKYVGTTSGSISFTSEYNKGDVFILPKGSKANIVRLPDDYNFDDVPEIRASIEQQLEQERARIFAEYEQEYFDQLMYGDGNNDKVLNTPGLLMQSQSEDDKKVVFSERDWDYDSIEKYRDYDNQNIKDEPTFEYPQKIDYLKPSYTGKWQKITSETNTNLIRAPTRLEMKEIGIQSNPADSNGNLIVGVDIGVPRDRILLINGDTNKLEIRNKGSKLVYKKSNEGYGFTFREELKAYSYSPSPQEINLNLEIKEDDKGESPLKKISRLWKTNQLTIGQAKEMLKELREEEL